MWRRPQVLRGSAEMVRTWPEVLNGSEPSRCRRWVDSALIPPPSGMLPYLSRISFWMATVAAAASLIAPEQGGPALATFAIAALMGALVLRRFFPHRAVVDPPETLDTVPIDDAALFDVATLLTRRLARSTSFAEALRMAADVLTLELGAVGVALLQPAGHPTGHPPAHGEPESIPRAVTGADGGGFALPVWRGDQRVALLQFQGTALQVPRASLLRWLVLLQAQLESIAQSEFSMQKSQRALEELQALSREFVDIMENVLFISNPERSNFEFLAGNAFHTLGVTPEQFERDSANMLMHLVEEDRPVLVERAQRERRLESTDITYRINHPIKGWRWIRSLSRPRVSTDGVLRVYGLASDVTADRAREAEMERARDAAEAASLAKSQFMANMSHEIRTPMNGILGMTELLLGASLNEQQRRFAKAVYRSGESLLEIINDILDFSKIEAGKFELSPADFSLRSVVEDTLELLAPRAHMKGLELSFHEAPGLPQMVHTDPLRLRQVLTNLIANAIKFTECGEVVVDLTHEPLPGGDGCQQLMLHFAVRDTGIGIDADVLPRLFQAFTQANAAMSRRYGGTGLGLAISKQLIEVMGGHIEVKSELGVGSQFEFSLPVQLASGLTDSVLAELDGSEFSAMRVLVVEDHATTRTVLENMLSAWGMHVTLAENGPQALGILRASAARDRNFDLAVISQRMPHLDGISLSRAVQSEGTHPAMKLILLASVSSPEEVRAAKLAGFDRFVPKPVRKGELRQAILGVSMVRRDLVPLMPNLLGNILVIEDNPVNQEVIGQMLRNFGLGVHVAANALHGLRALCEAHFDLVLMDIQMPGMDGIEALNWLRRGPGKRFGFVNPSATRVIAVTANALGGDEGRFLELGFDGYLSKPIRQSQLLAMLNKHLGPSAAAAAGHDAHSTSAGAVRPTDDTAVLAPASDGEGATQVVLDAGALDRLRELDPQGKNQLLARVAKAFETSTERLVPQLKDARRAAEPATVRHVAHTLKSASASIGALKLSQMCAEIEAMVRTERLDGLYDRVDSMCAEIELVLMALKRLPLDANP